VRRWVLIFGVSVQKVVHTAFAFMLEVKVELGGSGADHGPDIQYADDRNHKLDGGFRHYRWLK